MVCLAQTDFSIENIATKPHCKYGGGSMMMSDCYYSKGRGNHVRIHGIITSWSIRRFKKWKSACIWQYATTGLYGWIFQRDNNPKKFTQIHCSAMLYTWPSQPDLNSSENLWGELKTLYSMLNVGMPNISPIPHLTKDVNNSWADCRKLL